LEEYAAYIFRVTEFDSGGNWMFTTTYNPAWCNNPEYSEAGFKLYLWSAGL
jgi:hypothetical protein